MPLYFRNISEFVKRTRTISYWRKHQQVLIHEVFSTSFMNSVRKKKFNLSFKMSEEEKLWDRILQENMQKDKIAESHFILLGSKNTGKRALLQALQSGPGSRPTSVTSLLGTAEITSGALKYSYISVKNPED